MASNVLKFAAAIPLFHVGLCYWYLFCFYSGFGGGVVSLLNADDIFSVSLSDLAGTYLIGVIGVIASYLFFFDRPLMVAGRDTFEIHPTLKIRSMDWLFKATVWISAIGLALNFFLLDVFSSVLAVLLVAFLLGHLARRVSEQNNIPNGPIVLIAVTLMVIANISISAYKQGFALRHWPQASLSQDQLICGNWKIYRPLGDYFVAIGADDERAIIDSNCTVSFPLPKREVTTNII